MMGVFDKAFPNFEPVKRTTQHKFNTRSASIDPNYTAYKPYGWKIDEDPSNIGLKMSKEAMEIEAKIFEDLKTQNTTYAGKTNN